jgi:hypothetical protein
MVQGFKARNCLGEFSPRPCSPCDHSGARGTELRCVGGVRGLSGCLGCGMGGWGPVAYAMEGWMEGEYRGPCQCGAHGGPSGRAPLPTQVAGAREWRRLSFKNRGWQAVRVEAGTGSRNVCTWHRLYWAKRKENRMETGRVTPRAPTQAGSGLPAVLFLP